MHDGDKQQSRAPLDPAIGNNGEKSVFCHGSHNVIAPKRNSNSPSSSRIRGGQVGIPPPAYSALTNVIDALGDRPVGADAVPGAGANGAGARGAVSRTKHRDRIQQPHMAVAGGAVTDVGICDDEREAYDSLITQDLQMV